MTDLSRPLEHNASEPNAADARYHVVVRWLHWLMAACFVFMWGSGYYMRNLMPDDSPAQESLYDLHKSVGVTLFVLLLARLSARLLTRLRICRAGFRKPSGAPQRPVTGGSTLSLHLGS